MGNVIPGLEGMVRSIGFKKGETPEIADLFRIPQQIPEDEIEISEHFDGSIIAAINFSKFIESVLGTGASIPDIVPDVQ